MKRAVAKSVVTVRCTCGKEFDVPVGLDVVKKGFDWLCPNCNKTNHYGNNA